MKQLQGSKFVAVLLVLLLVAMAFVGCNNDRMGSISGPDTVSNTESQTLADSVNVASGSLIILKNLYPQSALLVLNFLRPLGQYTGGLLQVPNGTRFIVEPGAYIPPPGTLLGLPITITMKVEKNTNGVYGEELIYTFGPSGSQFSPGAAMWVDWKGANAPELYYIDDSGNYIYQAPDVIDYQNKKIKFLIHHFSRYALVHG